MPRAVFGTLSRADARRPGRPDAQAPRKEETIEPGWFYNLPKVFFDELIHSEGLCGLVVAGVADGEVCLASEEAGIRLVGFTLAEPHTNMLYDRLDTKTYEMMQDEHSPLFMQALKKIVVGEKLNPGGKPPIDLTKSDLQAR